MHFNSHIRFYVLASIFSVSTVYAYNYEEIKKWNATCAPKDTCSVPRDLDDSDSHNCDCSSLCTLYDTCCIDSPFLNISNKYERTSTCRPAGQSGENVFMIDVCPPSYKGHPAVRRRCEHTAKNWSDPFNNIPVTNLRSLKTYKSVFCAICNSENVNELKMWHVMLDCSTLTEYMEVCTENRDFVLNNMMYVREKGQWGLWSWDSKTDWNFRYLSLDFKMPPELKKHVKECRPNLVSTCSPSWRDAGTKRLCEAYMGSVYFQSVGFRNVHCAICNGVTNFTNMSCHDDTAPIYKSPTMSFGLLLDFDLRHGDKVGNVETKCSEAEVYDPFSKKCRTIECPIPGFTLKDGKCVPNA